MTENITLIDLLVKKEQNDKNRWDKFMATSSIFASFDIKDKKTAEDFVNALDKAKSYNIPTAIINEMNEMNDLNEIKAFLKLKV